MRLRRATWVLATVIGLSGCGAPLPPNLLVDPGFEGAPSAWATAGKARYRVVERAGRRGAGLRYRKEAEAGRENAHVDQVVAVEPGTAYVAGAWVRAEGDLRPVLRVATMTWKDIGGGKVSVQMTAVLADGRIAQELKMVGPLGENGTIPISGDSSADSETSVFPDPNTWVETTFKDGAQVEKTTYLFSLDGRQVTIDADERDHHVRLVLKKK